MQSILGTLLTSGYASAFNDKIASSPQGDQVSDAVQSQLTKSFAGAVGTAEQYLIDAEGFWLEQLAEQMVESEKAYDHLMDEHDREMFKYVKLFNPDDLYSKNPNPPDWNQLKPYYEDLVAKYLPATLKF